MYARTPIAAAPWELYKALKKYTHLDISLINSRNRYNDGRIFPYHLLMTSNNGTAIQALRESQVWHIHNYLVPEIVRLRTNQKVIAQFHSLPRLGNWKELMRFANACYTIKQPLHLKEYQLPGLPNIIDPDEYYPVRRKGKIKIAFAPTNRMSLKDPASKGYREVRQILNKVQSKRDVEVVWIEGINYEENLRLKQQSHILIDDVVTGNFHRTALEGACFGCCVMSSFKCKHFYYSKLNTLENDLLKLIDYDILLSEYQKRSRLWILKEWHPIDRILEYTKVYEEVLNA